MPVLAYSLATLAGICAYAGCNHLQVSAAGLRRRTHQLFACMCLTIALGAAAVIWLFQAHNAGAALMRVRWVITLICLHNAMFPWFIASYLEARARSWPSLFSSAFGLLALANCVKPYGIWFVTEPVLRVRQLPWGESIAAYASTSFNPWRASFWLAEVAVLLYCFVLCGQQLKTAYQRRPLLLGMGMGVLLLAGGNDWLVSIGVLRSVPGSGLFAFLALVLLMSWDLHREHQQRSRQMQALLDHVPAAVYAKDVQGRYLFVNRHFTQLVRSQQQHWIGRKDSELFPPETAELLSAHDAATLATGEPQRFEHTLDKDGALHSYLNLTFPIRECDSSAPYAIATVATDITERMRTEHALRSSEAQTRLLLDATEQGIIGVDIDARCTFVNRAALLMLGCKHAAELHGKRINELLGCPFEPASDDAFAPVRLTLQTGEGSHSAAAVCRRQDGSAFAMEYWSHSIRNKGRITGAVLSFSDISERKRVDDAIRALAEASAALDSDAFFEYCVHSLAEVYDAKYAVIGLFNRDKTRVRTVAVSVDHHIVANYEYEVADSPCAEVSAQVRKLIPTKVSERYGNPELKQLRVESYFGSPIVSPCGKTIGVVAVLGTQPLRIGSSSESMLDVFAHRISVELDRKLALDRLNELNESLERRVAERTKELSQINEELEAFSYSVSHDLRAPIATMAGFSSLLLDQYADSLDPTCKRYLQHIAGGAQRMSGLIDALLSLARVTRQAPRRTQLDMSELARECIAKLRATEPQRQMQISIAPRLLAHADADLLAIVLDNLLGNAWKYTAKTTNPRVELGATEQAGELIYYVRDNGAGFDPEYAHRLFQPFQRLHHQKEFPGTGIGLATVARIIHRHGGRIRAEGAKGRGATFYFTLPSKASLAAAQSVATESRLGG